MDTRSPFFTPADTKRDVCAHACPDGGRLPADLAARGEFERTLRLEHVGELTDLLQQLPVGHRQLVAGLVAFPETNANKRHKRDWDDPKESLPRYNSGDLINNQSVHSGRLQLL